MTEHSALLPCVGVEGTPGSVSARCATPRKPPNASWALPPAHSPSRSPRPPSCNSICCFKKIKAFLKNVVHGIRLLNGPMVESTLARIQICSDPNPREQLKKSASAAFNIWILLHQGEKHWPIRKTVSITGNVPAVLPLGAIWTVLFSSHCGPQKSSDSTVLHEPVGHPAVKKIASATLLLALAGPTYWSAGTISS